MEKDLILNLSPIAFTKLISKGVLTNVKNDDYLRIVSDYMSKPKTQPVKVVVTETNKPASASRSSNSNTNDKPFTKAVGEKVSIANTVNKISLDFSQPIRANWYDERKSQKTINSVSSLENKDTVKQKVKVAKQPETEVKQASEKSEVKKEKKNTSEKSDSKVPIPKAVATQQTEGKEKSNLNVSVVVPKEKREEVPEKEVEIPKGASISKKTNNKSKTIQNLNFDTDVDEKKVFTNPDKKEDLPIVVPIEQSDKDKIPKPDTAKKVSSEVAKRLEKLNRPIEEDDVLLLEKLIDGVKPSQKGIVIKNKKAYDLLQGSSTLLFKLDTKEVTSLNNIASYKGENSREEMKEIIRKYSK